MPSYPTHFQAMCVFEIDLQLLFLDTFTWNIIIDRDYTLYLCQSGYLYIQLMSVACNLPKSVLLCTKQVIFLSSYKETFGRENQKY